MKYGKVLTYKDTEEAKRLIGKKVVFANRLYVIDNPEPQKSKGIISNLEGICEIDPERPFYAVNVDGSFQFIREIIEEPVLMSNRQLAEWLARGNGQAKSKDEDTVRAVPCSHWNYIADEDSDPVDEVVVIRSWDSDAWLTPTLEIYERDCKKEAK